jgi:membrane protein
VISFAQIKDLLVESWNEWNKDQAPRLGAALAFYTMLSLAPLLIILIAGAGLVFGDDAVRGQLFGQIRDLMGTEGATAVEEMVANASKPATGTIATLLGFGTLIWGATTVASELRNSLNQIWKDQPPGAENESLKETIANRGTALGVVLGAGFLLLTSLAVSSVIAAAGKWFVGFLPFPEVILTVLNFVLGLAVITGVFAVLFRYLPDARPPWSDVFLGAGFTAVLFSIGKLAIGVYLGKASFGSSYGAAGSLVIVLVWVYYSAQILFFGAEFTECYARRHGTAEHTRKEEYQGPPEQGGGTPEIRPGVGELPEQAASGQTGVLGSLLGSALAATRIVRGLRR